MNRYILAFGFCLIVGLSYGQQASFSTNASFMLSANFHGKEDGTWIQKVTQVNFMILDKKKTEDAEVWKKLIQELRDQRFEEMVSYRKGKDRMRLMSRDANGIKEMAFMVEDEDGGLYIRFAGKFTAHDLEQMQLSIQDK